jgi:hypothetical protein
MIEFFYNEVLDTATKSNIMDLPSLTYTPAEVGKILFEHFGNMDGAINALKTQIKTKPIEEMHVQEPDDKCGQDKHITDMQANHTSSYIPMASYKPMSLSMNLTKSKSEYDTYNPMNMNSYSQYESVEPLWSVVN